jgi:hypothetical protein
VVIGVLIFLLGGLGIFLSSIKQTSETPKALSKPSEPSKPSEQPAISLSIMKDKSIYGKGQKAEITCQLTNLKKDVLRDIWGELKIPGFDLNYDQTYIKKKWLEREGQITHKVTFNIPKDVPSGKYKIILEMHASSLEKRFEEKAEAFFEVE